MTGADVTSYTELIGAIEAQRMALGMRQSDFDDLCGFPPGLWGKAAGLLQVKRLGPEKCFDALRGAGLRIRVEIDPQQHEKMLRRIAENYNPRQANQARPANSASRISNHLKTRVYGYFLKEARKKRWVNKSKEERSEHARMMAMAGIKKRREQKKRAQSARHAANARWIAVRKRNRAMRQGAAHRAANAERRSEQ